MMILRPDPAEYIEDFGCGPVRPIDVLSGAIGYASAYGLTIHDIERAAIAAENIRDFDRIVAEMIEQRKAA